MARTDSVASERARPKTARDGFGAVPAHIEPLSAHEDATGYESQTVSEL
jgi:hypothetical protein